MKTTLESKIARLFSISEETWARHANPWSVWTRFTVLPVLGDRVWLNRKEVPAPPIAGICFWGGVLEGVVVEIGERGLFKDFTGHDVHSMLIDNSPTKTWQQ
jgi:hypothetical protein